LKRQSQQRSKIKTIRLSTLLLRFIFSLECHDADTVKIVNSTHFAMMRFRWTAGGHGGLFVVICIRECAKMSDWCQVLGRLMDEVNAIQEELEGLMIPVDPVICEQVTRMIEELEVVRGRMKWAREMV
jgi:hypothetical protein